MELLLDSIEDFESAFYRNVVSRRVSEDLFDDITGADVGLNALAIQLEMRVKQHIPADKVSRGMHYSTAVNHVFDTEPYMESRYGDGTFPVLYGSVELDTTVHETAYHFAKFVFDSGDITELVKQDRAAYELHCRALLIDLSGKRDTHPQLVGEDYKYTQGIARRVSSEGHPGLLVPSARTEGTNLVIFNRDVISEVSQHCYFTYTLDPTSSTVIVERQPGEVEHAIDVKGAR